MYCVLMKNTHFALALCLSAVLGSSQLARGADHDWPQWRGPNFNGSSEAANLPESIDRDKAAWTATLSGVGNGTPVIAGGRIFVSCVEEGSGKLMANAISSKDGKILWSKEVGTGLVNNKRNNAASPSAVTDGKLVYFFYSTGDLACFDVEGKEVWHRNIQKDHGEFNVLWVYSSSPLLYKGKLYIQVLHRNVKADGLKGGEGGVDSYFLAVDPQTGKDIWKVVRPTDAKVESRESYATPIPFEHMGRTDIVLVGGDCVTCHDAETGKEIWRAGGWNPEHITHWRLVPSVTVDPADNLVFACVPKGGPVMAISANGTGDVTATHYAWKSDGKSTGITSDVTVPLYYKNDLYLLAGEKKVLFILDPKSGKPKNSVSFDTRTVFRASPTGADGKIYVMNEAGEAWVVTADTLKVVGHSQFEKDSRGTIAVADGLVVIRSGKQLFGFRK